jgi:tRNA A-37 threonylcarbamoyl transferase component Bud32
MSLPPLRTVARDPVALPRPAGAPPAMPAPAATPPPARPRPATLDAARLPAEVKGFLGELVEHNLLSAADLADLFAKVGDRLPHLTSRQKAADALVAHGFLSRYQAERSRTGQAYGLTVGNYRLVERISGGTVGIVFRGEHAVMRRPVAVKLLPADDAADPLVIGRFQAEARLLAGISHPHVVTAYDAGLLPTTAPGQPDLHYLILELITGGDLENHIYKHGVQPPAVAAEWGRQIAGGLHAAHTAGLVHRDLKPSNVLLTEGLQAKITDFGLAREVGSTVSRHGRLLGTVEFMAPEQLADAPTCGPPADVYGLGATLFWVLTGQLPYEPARTLAEGVDRLKTGRPRKLRQIDPQQPAELAALVDRMLARDPADRPTASEAMHALTPLAAGSVLLTAEGDAAAADGAEVARLRAAVGLLEQTVKAKAAEADQVRKALWAGLAAAAAARPDEPPGHQRRVAAYTRALATVLASHPDWAMLADPRYVDDLARAAALHDLGLVGQSDRPGAADHHPKVGSDVLFAAAQAGGPALPALRLVRAVVRNHHERWDGAGFPDRLAGPDIPPAARLVAVAVAYDDLRRLDPPQPHARAAECLQAGAGAAFDPQVVAAFADAAAEFERVYDVIPDRDGQPAPGAGLQPAPFAPPPITPTRPFAPPASTPVPGGPPSGRLRRGPVAPM